MPVTLADLLRPMTESEVRATLLGLLQTGGFPTASWATQSVPRRLIDVASKVIADLTVGVADVAASGFLDYIPKTENGYLWLKLVAEQVYGFAAKEPVFTQGGSGGRIVLTDTIGAGPYTILPRTLVIGTVSGRLFTNVGGGTLPASGTLGTLTWEALNPGAAFNVPINTIVQMKTPLLGVTVNNPGVSGEWIVRYGADRETHDSLVLRCRARWPELGAGASNLVWTGWALAGSAETVRARVFEDEPRDGAVRVVLASASGPVSPTAISDTEAYLAPRRPLGSKPFVQSASVVSVPVVVRLRVAPAYVSGAEAEALDTLVQLQNELDIGAPLLHYELSKRLMQGQGVVDLIWTTPTINTVIASTEVITLAPTLTIESAA